MTERRPAPVPYDPELEPGLAAFIGLVEQIPLRADTISANRAVLDSITPPMDEQVGDRKVQWEDLVIPGPSGTPDLAVTIVRPRAAARPAAGVVGIHGGGMVLGTRFFGTPELIDLADRHGMVGVAVEYRLAPEHPGPAGAEDCYAATSWFASHADDLGVDPRRIMVSGFSAGGGLSAAVALMSRDRGGPHLAGQLLGCPMLDDRNITVSSRQYDGIGAWDRHNNDVAWNAVLGEARFTDGVSPYSAPSRATELSGLPPAYIEVGAAEVFRDEATDYATGLWAAGGQAELHVWAGGYHGFSGFSPESNVARAAVAARRSWIQRILGT